MSTLYHRTTPAAAANIRDGGFRDPTPEEEDGEPVGVWLSPAFDCMGEKGRTLIEVVLNPSIDLDPYHRRAEFGVSQSSEQKIGLRFKLLLDQSL